MEIDTSTEFGARVEQRLADERIIWLVTTDREGAPQPSPVWFIWDGESALMYSQPNTPKLRNIEANPRVSLHFNSDEYFTLLDEHPELGAAFALGQNVIVVLDGAAYRVTP